MTHSSSTVVDTYSRSSELYAADGNQLSCWGLDTSRIIRKLRLESWHRTVVDVGCGTGHAVRELAARGAPGTSFIAIEPAAEMRSLAQRNLADVSNVDVVDGRFENMQLTTSSVDYLFSINALHWCSDLRAALDEMARVLKVRHQMDHYFIGRDVGREFIRATTPVLLRYMGPQRLLKAAMLRQSMTQEQALELFRSKFRPHAVTVRQRYDTYFDSVEGHMGWWVRIEPQLLGIPQRLRAECEQEVRAALAELETDSGVPYTKHTLHVHVRSE